MKITCILLSCVLFGGVSCTTITGDTDSVTNFKDGVPGGEVIETSKITATVTGIDATKRKVTLVTKDSKKMVVTAGPEVKNFNQIKVGDQLTAVLTEEVLVRMAKPGEKLEDKGEVTVGVARKGAKPGLVTMETIQTSATVTAIDLKRRKVTLQFADGKSKKFPVRKDVDLSQGKVGDKVVIRSTELFAIQLEKP